MKPMRCAIASWMVAIALAGDTIAQGLPGGATSLAETHGDWTVTCRLREDVPSCTMSQVQLREQDRQRILSIELQAVAEGASTEGTLVLPFGLKLEEGIRLTIDESEFLSPLRFLTCLPAGCVVPLVIDADAVSALKAGGALSVGAFTADVNQQVSFTISLSGFSSALDRLVQLNNR